MNSPVTRALIVEDDAATLRLLEEICVGLGHGVATAACREDAEALLEQEEFDYVLLDHCLPNRPDDIHPRKANGQAVLEGIRKRHTHLLPNGEQRPQVIMFTGMTAHADVIAVMRSPNGANEHVIKMAPEQDIGLEDQILARLESMHRRPVDWGDLEVEQDYGLIRWRGQVWRFRGPQQKKILRLLHQAALRGQPRLRVQDLMQKVCGDPNRSLSQQFSKRKGWGELIAQKGGSCWLIPCCQD